MSYYSAVRNIPDQPNSLSSVDVTLDVRQHPQNALVTPENKEKTRKPIDPPPIVQLKVNSDRQRDWLVNPFLFMNAVLVSTDDERPGQPKTLQGNQLLGQNVSSLHRLKDIDNKDGGFFVFGDISCRRTGMYRLQFNLFNYERDEVNFLSSATSQRFRVMTAKEYPGLQESTHLSRTFSDQGVRLRLRKENRSGAVKRSYAASSEVYEIHDTRPSTGMSSGGPVQNYPYDQQERGYIKRQRSDSDYTSPHAYASYARSAMPQYGMPGGNAYGQQHQPAQHNPQSQLAHMVTPVQQSVMPSWQHAQSSYSAPPGGSSMGMGSGSYFGVNSGSGHAPRIQTYGQTSPQYGGRTSNELYTGVNNLPTPVSEQSMGSAQSSMGGYGQSAALSAGIPSRGHPVQPYDISNPSAQYPPQPHGYSQTTQAYQPPPSNVSFENHPQNPMKIEAHGYGDSPNMYNVPQQQNAYASGHTEGFSSNDLPLESSILNREFAGASAFPPPPPLPEPHTQESRADGGTYGDIPGQPDEMTGYPHVDAKSAQPHHQQQSAAYPTPHQTSPTHLQDHG